MTRFKGITLFGEDINSTNNVSISEGGWKCGAVEVLEMTIQGGCRPVGNYQIGAKGILREVALFMELILGMMTMVDDDR